MRVTGFQNNFQRGRNAKHIPRDLIISPSSSDALVSSAKKGRSYFSNNKNVRKRWEWRVKTKGEKDLLGIFPFFFSLFVCPKEKRENKVYRFVSCMCCAIRKEKKNLDLFPVEVSNIKSFFSKHKKETRDLKFNLNLLCYRNRLLARLGYLVNTTYQPKA